MLTPEWVSAISSVVTLLIVAVGSYAAVRQIRHLRLGTQTEAFLRLAEAYQSERVVESRRFVMRELPALLEREDPQTLFAPIRGEARRALPLLNFYEEVGILVLAEALPEELVLSAFPLEAAWNRLEPYIGLARRSEPGLGECFELLVVRAEDRRLRRGTTSAYPSNTRRKLPFQT